MISLYDSTETNFSHNGLVVLSDCKTAFVEEELNGKYELELEYPIDARGKWQYLIEGNLIKADGQLFRIYHKEKTLAGIKVYARHIFYDLLDNFIENCSIGNLNAPGALNAVLSNTQYSHDYISMSDIDVSNTYSIEKQNPVEAILGENGVIIRYGGELVRDNFTLRLLQNRGMDRGVLVSYGKNVMGIEETLDMGSVVTRLLPIGKEGLILPGKYLDSSIIGSYPHPIVKSVEFADCETESALRAAGQKYLTQNDKPLVNYAVDFIELTKTEEYKHYSILETVYMGDTVTVRHSKLNIALKCKVIRIKKNLLTNRIEEVELGSFKPNLASSINSSLTNLSNQQAQDKSDLQQAIDNATLQINSALGGYVVKRNGELLIMDTEDINTATKVWRWNQGGLGYSGTGYNGPFRTAITADGHIVADFVDTGSLTAGIVKTGTLTSKTGKLSIGLDDEVLNIGGKIVYDGATGEVTFAPSVVLSWANLPLDVVSDSQIPTDEHITTLSQNAITTSTVRLDQLTGAGSNPIIKLFKDLTVTNGGDPALDATDNLNQGIGNQIRLKWNDSNYIGVANNMIGFYFYYAGLGGTTAKAEVRPDGFYFDGVPLGGGSGDGTVTTVLDFFANGTGFQVTLDSTVEIWTWVKNASSQITSMSSNRGRTVTINRGV